MTSSSDQPQPNDTAQHPAAQPEYGQVNQPEYGAMASQYPAGYDPYVYGRPDTEQPSATPESPSAGVPGSFQGSPQQDEGRAWVPQYGVDGQEYGRQLQHDQYRRQQGGLGPFGNIDMDDPGQNPLYGHWDFLAILSLVFALLMPMPLLPAVFGGVAMWRTRTFRMKGYGLALAAVIINVIYTLVMVWMMFNGLNTLDLYQQLLGGMTEQGGVEDTTSIHA